MSRLELKIPPPLLALTIGLLMWWLARSTPALELSESLRLAGALGPALLGMGAALAGVIHFRRAGTTIHPLTPERSSVLIDGGIYRFSRNPMYLGMVLVLLGWSIWLTAPATLIGPPIFMALITRFQIMPEERALEALFGERFEEYRKRVRRWL